MSLHHSKLEPFAIFTPSTDANDTGAVACLLWCALGWKRPIPWILWCSECLQPESLFVLFHREAFFHASKQRPRIRENHALSRAYKPHIFLQYQILLVGWWIQVDGRLRRLIRNEIWSIFVLPVQSCWEEGGGRIKRRCRFVETGFQRTKKWV